VGRPDAFAETVRQVARGPVELLSFSDHHAYRARDVARVLRRARGRPVVVTEKDAIKLVPHVAGLGETWVLTEELRWSWGEGGLRDRLEALAAARVRP
jgi:tetraacyldisaccharide 4'-kinase